MSDLTTTVDIIGDAALHASIIDRSITEISDELVQTLGTYVLAYCGNLKTVKFHTLTKLGQYAFYSSTALTTADFPVCKEVESSAFYNCSALVSLILRKTGTICTLSSTNTLYGTPIKSGTGYIYVPRALVDSYKSATNWSSFANQFRALEDYTVDGTITGDLDPSKI